MSARPKAYLAQLDLMDAERILINPLNNSTTKQQFSFPKAPRFPRSKTHNHQHHFYNIPSTKSNRAATLSHRSDRTSLPHKPQLFPSPNQYKYTKDGQFGSGRNMIKSRGFIFGLSRDDIKINNFLTIRKDTISPGTYNVQTPKANSKQFSFPKSLRKTYKRMQFPNIGPAKYKVKTSFGSQSSILSTDHRSIGPKMSSPKVQKKVKNCIYPPLYHPKVTSRGQKTDFKQMIKCAIMGKSKRFLSQVSTTVKPGPGQYKIFSEFISKGKY